MAEPTDPPPDETGTPPRAGDGRVRWALMYLIVLGHVVVDQTRGRRTPRSVPPEWSVGLIAVALLCLVGVVGLLLPSGRGWIQGRSGTWVRWGPLVLFLTYILTLRR